MPNENDNIQPDLLEAVDSLLEEVKETTESFAPPKEPAVDLNAPVSDTGPLPKIKRELEQGTAPDGADDGEDPDADAEANAESGSTPSEPVDSIENAKQALDAIEDIESQAEDLIAQSVESLLADADAVSEPEQSEPQTEVAEPETISESEPESVSILDPESGDESTEEPIVESPDDSINDDAQATDDPASPETNPEATEDTDDLLASIDQLLEESSVDAEIDTPEEATPVEDNESEPAPVQVSEPVSEPAAEPDSNPEPALEEVIVPVADEDTPSADSSDDSMDLLDSALAEAADDFLDGDFETEEGDLVSGEAVASAIEDALEDQPSPDSVAETQNAEDPLASLDMESVAQAVSEAQPVPDLVIHPDETPESPAAQEDQPAATVADPQPETQPAAVSEQETQSEIEALEEVQDNEPVAFPAWLDRGIEIIRPKLDKIDPLKGKTMDAAGYCLGTLIVLVMTHATPVAASVMILLSKPLENKPAEVRNAIGYITLWTGFLAAVVWVYLLMFRAPHIPSPDSAPTRVIDADESLIIQPVIEVLP